MKKDKTPNPIAPLLLQHTELLGLLAAGLTIYEAAMHLEIDAKDADILRRQAYLRLGVFNLKDALMVSNIKAPDPKPVKPKPVRRPDKRNKEERKRQILELIASIFGPLVRSWHPEMSPIGLTWPDEVWVVSYPERNSYLELDIQRGLTGLPCFSSYRIVGAFLEALRVKPKIAKGCNAIQVTFDEAREIAKASDNVAAVALMDNPEEPLLHFVR